MKNEGGYNIAITDGDPVLRMTIWGMWDDATAQAARRDLNRRLRPDAGDPVRGILVDARRSIVQTQSVLGHIKEAYLAQSMVPTAILLPESALLALQVRRVGIDEGRFATFTDEKTAMAWLTSRD